MGDIVIIGGTKGGDRELATELVRRGYDVVIAGRSAERANTVSDEINSMLAASPGSVRGAVELATGRKRHGPLRPRPRATYRSFAPASAVEQGSELQRDWVRTKNYDAMTGLTRVCDDAHSLDIICTKTMFGASEGH